MSNDNRSQNLNVRLTPQEKAVLVEFAKDKHLTPSKYIRYLLREETRRHAQENFEIAVAENFDKAIGGSVELQS